MIGNWFDTLPYTYKVLIEFIVYIVLCYILLRFVIALSELIGEKIIVLVQRLKK